VKIFIHAPIAPPRLWIASGDAESPPGFIRLIGASIAPRSMGKTSGSNPVETDDISHKTSLSTDIVPVDDLRVQTQRLFEAFARCDAGARAEVIAIAERLAGVTP
jgi:hypothetical protein